MARLSKAALAAGNVVLLPTAAPRQVQQSWNRATREARRTLREQCPWPGEHLCAGQRDAIRKAELLSQIVTTPELLLVKAILGTMDDDARVKVAERIAPGAAAGLMPYRQAVAVLQTSRTNVGEQVDLDFAFRRLRGEDC